jgi:hypothetical protein
LTAVFGQARAKAIQPTAHCGKPGAT